MEVLRGLSPRKADFFMRNIKMFYSMLCSVVMMIMIIIMIIIINDIFID